MRIHKKIRYIIALISLSVLGAGSAAAVSDVATIPAGSNTYTWSVTGYQELSVTESTSTFTSLAFDGNTPYLATVDENGALTVRQFDGTDWRIVGSPEFATNVFRVSLIISWGSRPVVAYTDDTTGAIISMAFDGESWGQLGSSPGYQRPNGNPHLGMPSLVYNPVTGTLLMAYTDYIDNTNTPVVKEIWWEWNTPTYGSGWDDFSSVSFSLGGDYVLHSFTSGLNFYLAYTEAGTNKPVTLYLEDAWKRSEVSGTFSGTGNSISITGTDTIGIAYANQNSIGFANWTESEWAMQGLWYDGGPYKRVSLDADSNNIPYVLYVADSGSYVMRYDGSSWHQVGTVPFFLDTDRIDSATLMFDSSDILYVTYIDAAHKAVVRKFDGTEWTVVNAYSNIPPLPTISATPAWDTVGHQAISTSESISTTVSFVYPYLATVNGGGSLTVRKFDGASWATVGSAWIATNVFRVSLALHGTLPILAYTDDTTGAITVLNFDGTSWNQIESSPGNQKPNDNPHLGAPSLVVDQSTDYLYIAFVDNTNVVNTWKLNLADWPGATWHTFTDNFLIPAAGGDCSPRILWEGGLYMSYISATGMPVAAYYDGSSDWIPASNGGLVDGGNNMSMTILDGKVNISYAGASNVGVAEVDWWDWVMEGYSAGASGSHAYSSITHDANNIPYVLYVTNTASGTQAHFARYDRDWALWTQVGSVPFSLDSTKTDSASISFDTGTNALYVAYIDAAHKAVVRKLNGADWVVIDNGFNTSHGIALSSNPGSETSMALDSSNTPYVAYIDSTDSDKATVMTFTSGAWSTVGTTGFSAANITHLSLALDSNNIPYVAYRDGDGKATVMKYDGSSWVVVGSAGFSTGSVAYASLAFDSNNIPYVAYQDAANSNKATVMKYDGSSWVVVGSAGFSANTSNYLSLKIDTTNNIPYVAYQDAANSNKATVMKYDGSSWVVVGSAGFSTGSVNNTVLMIDSYHTLYVAYQDAANSNKATVMKYDGSSWTTIGSAGFSAGAVNTGLSLIVDSGHVPYVAYGDSGNNGKGMVSRYNGTGWTTIGSTTIGSGNITYTALGLGSDNVLYAAYSDNGIGGRIAAKKITVDVSAPPPPPPDPSSGTVSVTAPDSITFSTTTVSNTIQTIDASVWPFSVADTKGASAGYYTTLSISDLSDGLWHTIAKSHVSANVSWGTIMLISGTENASVTVPSDISTGYVSIGDGTTLLQRTEWGDITGTYGVSLDLRINIPAYSATGDYSGTLTFTIMEN